MAVTTTHEDDEHIHATSSPDPAPAPALAPVYQTPDWEIPTNYPPPKRSFRNSLTLLSSAAVAAVAASSSASRHPEDAATAAAAAESGTAKREETAAPGTITSTTTTAAAFSSSAKPSLAAAARKRLDAVLPPHKKYLGRSRRFLLLCAVLPLALLLFVVLPLAVGLGVGLARRRQHRNPPLPGGGDDGGIFTGELTYYDVGLGACGVQSSEGEALCSISHVVFDAAAAATADGDGSGGGVNPNTNPLCGRKIRITRENPPGGAGNRSVDVTVVDRCVGCGPTDLDLSLAAFEQLALRESGRVVGSWAWLDE